ncbi:hypothetical protein [Asanoa iriomotensis]|uniref:Uncharacterized protein n=1 Tax=Asanoa iriomotensis TaxID=234613 RepID=A0ABQ4BYR9_9ACTN|nr:hypothetical protein [Asanoa iriomotensis]GIF55681.1 hypothetical protein Air01nite_17760 [Asanoa iriomotensis]
MHPIVPPPPNSRLAQTLGQLDEAVRQLPAGAEHSAPASLRREAIALAEVIHRNGDRSGVAHTAEANRLLHRIRGYLAATAKTR